MRERDLLIFVFEIPLHHSGLQCDQSDWVGGWEYFPSLFNSTVVVSIPNVAIRKKSHPILDMRIWDHFAREIPS